MTRGRFLVRRTGYSGSPPKPFGWNRLGAAAPSPSPAAPTPPPEHTPNPFAGLVAPQQDKKPQPGPDPSAAVPPPSWPEITGLADAAGPSSRRSPPGGRPRAWLARPLLSRRFEKEYYEKLADHGDATRPRWPDLSPGSRGSSASRQPPPLSPSSSSSPAHPQPRPIEKPAALYLSATSTSLLPSDFYRLAPQSEHVHFWTTRNSLRAVLQARHPITHQPLGHYTLIFDSIAAAAAYLDAARRLHLRSGEPGVLGLPTARVPRAVLPFRVRKVGLGTPSWGRSPQQQQLSAGGSGANIDRESPLTTPGGHPRDAFLASWPEFLGHAFDVRSFTLAPPSVPLTMRVRPLTEPGEDEGEDEDYQLTSAILNREDSARFSSAKKKADHGAATAGPEAWSRALGGELSRAVRNRDLEVTQVLCSFDNVGGDTSGGLTRQGITLPSIGRLIDLDGRRRNLTWRLRASDAVLPVRTDVMAADGGALGAPDVSIHDVEAALASGVDLTGDLLRYSSSRQQQPQPDGDDEDARGGRGGPPGLNEPRYRRYLLSFQDAAEAKRFAREWHRKRVLVKGEIWRVNATALW